MNVCNYSYDFRIIRYFNYSYDFRIIKYVYMFRKYRIWIILYWEIDNNVCVLNIYVKECVYMYVFVIYREKKNCNEEGLNIWEIMNTYICLLMLYTYKI